MWRGVLSRKEAQCWWESGSFQGEAEFQTVYKNWKSQTWIQILSIVHLWWNYSWLHHILLKFGAATGWNWRKFSYYRQNSSTLMEKYLGEGHHLYIDNYCTSIPLAQGFLWNDTYVPRTIRKTRKHFPLELKRVTLYRGGSAYLEHDDMIVMKFRAHQDRSSGKAKVVHLLMTAHKPLQANTSKSNRSRNIIQKPGCIIDYNYMGGVDMMDQQLDRIEVLRRSYKWYKKLFLRLLMQYVLAPHKLSRKQWGKDEFLIYTLDLCTLLISQVWKPFRKTSNRQHNLHLLVKISSQVKEKLQIATKWNPK